MKVEEINPYNSNEDKGKEIEQMFDSISRKYDFMNSAMSLGQHKRWRNKALNHAISYLHNKENLSILDVATGTGDVAFRLHELLPEALITGIDLSEGMLEVAREKLFKLPEPGRSLIAFGKGDSLLMPFHDGEFSLVTVAYGVRNFSDLRKGIEEMKRVLTSGGVLCIIELSVPEKSLTKWLYKIYSGKLIPRLGKVVSGDSNAYFYLPESIMACPQREDMAALLYASGFREVIWKSLSFGAVTYYVAK